MAGDAYPDGVWWVPLAALREPELVLETAAQAVGARTASPSTSPTSACSCSSTTSSRLYEAAGDVAGLLAACPNLDLLVTSREPLHVTGEQEYAVPPLAHRGRQWSSSSPAHDRSRPTSSADDAVSEICRRLDDLPLALELAAARVKALSSTQILERLSSACRC